MTIHHQGVELAAIFVGTQTNSKSQTNRLEQFDSIGED